MESVLRSQTLEKGDNENTEADGGENTKSLQSLKTFQETINYIEKRDSRMLVTSPPFEPSGKMVVASERPFLSSGYSDDDDDETANEGGGVTMTEGSSSGEVFQVEKHLEMQSDDKQRFQVSAYHNEVTAAAAAVKKIDDGNVEGMGGVVDNKEFPFSLEASAEAEAAAVVATSSLECSFPSIDIPFLQSCPLPLLLSSNSSSPRHSRDKPLRTDNNSSPPRKKLHGNLPPLIKSPPSQQIKSPPPHRSKTPVLKIVPPILQQEQSSPSSSCSPRRDILFLEQNNPKLFVSEDIRMREEVNNLIPLEKSQKKIPLSLSPIPPPLSFSSTPSPSIPSSFVSSLSRTTTSSFFSKSASTSSLGNSSTGLISSSPSTLNTTTTTATASIIEAPPLSSTSTSSFTQNTKALVDIPSQPTPPLQEMSLSAAAAALRSPLLFSLSSSSSSPSSSSTSSPLTSTKIFPQDDENVQKSTSSSSSCITQCLLKDKEDSTEQHLWNSPSSCSNKILLESSDNTFTSLERKEENEENDISSSLVQREKDPSPFVSAAVFLVKNSPELLLPPTTNNTASSLSGYNKSREKESLLYDYIRLLERLTHCERELGCARLQIAELFQRKAVAEIGWEKEKRIAKYALAATTTNSSSTSSLSAFNTKHPHPYLPYRLTTRIETTSTSPPEQLVILKRQMESVMKVTYNTLVSTFRPLLADVLKPKENGLVIHGTKVTQEGGILIIAHNKAERDKIAQLLTEAKNKKLDKEFVIITPAPPSLQFRVRKEAGAISASELKNHLFSEMNPFLSKISAEDQKIEIRETKIGFILNVSAKAYQALRQQRRKIFVNNGNDVITAQDYISMHQCYRCGRFGHSVKNCTYAQICRLCSSTAHPGWECWLYQWKEEGKINEYLRCSNCEEHNRKFGTQFSLTHSAANHKKCKVAAKWRFRQYLRVQSSLELQLREEEV